MVVDDEVVLVGGKGASSGTPAPAIITPRATVAVPAVRVG